MNVLIIEGDPGLGSLWKAHIVRSGAAAELVQKTAQALDQLNERDYDVVIMNLHRNGSDTLAFADYVSYRRPKAKIIFVTSDSFFSNGSIFEFMSNACAMVPESTPPEDMVALVDYHGR